MVAEKFEAMVLLGETNTRLKDFYDVWFLARAFDFEGTTLSEAVRATFARRGTELPAKPLPLGAAFGQDAVRQSQWRAFLHRTGVADAPETSAGVMATLAAFLGPIADTVAAQRPFADTWRAPGHWRPT